MLVQRHPTLLNPTMLHDVVEQRLTSIKHRLQYHPTFLLFLGLNNNVAFVWPPHSTLLGAFAHRGDAVAIDIHGDNLFFASA